jgi:hypothetical protein
MNNVNFELLRQGAKRVKYFTDFPSLKTLAAQGSCYRLIGVKHRPRLERWVALQIHHERDMLLAHQGTYNELTGDRASKLVACVPELNHFSFCLYLPGADRLDKPASQEELFIFYHCWREARRILRRKRPLADQLAKVILPRLPATVPPPTVLPCGPWPHDLGFSEHELNFNLAPLTMQ